MKTATDHLRKYPSTRPQTLAFIEKRNAMTERLKAEIKASKPSKSIIERFIPWFGRRG